MNSYDRYNNLISSVFTGNYSEIKPIFKSHINKIEYNSNVFDIDMKDDDNPYLFVKYNFNYSKNRTAVRTKIYFNEYRGESHGEPLLVEPFVLNPIILV